MHLSRTNSGPPRVAARASSLTVRNRQRRRRVNTALLRRILPAALQEAFPEGCYDLAFHLVSATEITRLNESFLQHRGPTDVITFDYSESADGTADARGRDAGPGLLHGEIFVCLELAIAQARPFRTTWQSELVRYCVHGLLHLLGYDDRNARVRRRMKAAEDRLLRHLAREFPLRQLATAA